MLLLTVDTASRGLRACLCASVREFCRAVPVQYWACYVGDVERIGTLNRQADYQVRSAGRSGPVRKRLKQLQRLRIRFCAEILAQSFDKYLVVGRGPRE